MRETITTHTYSVKNSICTETVNVVSQQNDVPQNVSAYIVPGFYTGPSHYTEFVRTLIKTGHQTHTIDILGAPTCVTGNFLPYAEQSIVRAWSSAAYTAISEHQAEANIAPLQNLIGYSLGTAGATLVALELPAVKKLVLIAPIGPLSAFETFVKKLYALRITRPIAHALYYPYIGLRSWLAIQQKIKLSAKDKMARERYQHSATDVLTKIREGSNKIGYRVALAKLTFDFEKHIKTLIERGVRVYIIGMAKDRYISSKALEKVAKKTGATCIILPGNHDLMKTHPDIVVAHVDTFLQDNS